MQDRIRESGRPLAAPSAKASGSISPTRAEHVLAGLGGKISMILDAGPTERGLESTIVAPDEDHIRLLRPGPITAEMLHSLTSLPVPGAQGGKIRSEEHTSELQSLMRISYAVFCLKKNTYKH